MSKILIISLITILASCGTFRPWQDSEVALATGGVRTMVSNACWLGAGCIEKSVMKAKEECLSENKKYEYVSHNIFYWGKVLYRCI
jgi:hypothetical protein